jgi:ATP-binding cassette subfamily C protein CydD
VKPVDPRLLSTARAARSYLAATVGLGLAVTALVLAQATLLAHAIARVSHGTSYTALRGTLLLLLAVVAARGLATYGGEVAALRAAARVKSQLRRRLVAHALRLGPVWLGGQRSGELSTLATRGLDALDPYFARYLPQLVLAALVPLAVLVRIVASDWISALVIVLTLPLIPVFMVLVGLHTRRRTERQWRLLARLGGHFLDVVEGLPTLKVFNRAKAQAQIVRDVTEEHRQATMATLRIAFLSALVLELLATIATAMVAVEVGLRLLDGDLGYETALVVLLLTPEAYLPLRQVGVQFHASMEGVAAAQQVFDVLDTEPPVPVSGSAAGGGARADLRADAVHLEGVSVTYPGRATPALDAVTLTVAPGERLAVVGRSGAGKSTLLSLLLRFVAPTSGTVRVGGVDLDQVDLDDWRRQVTWVPQQPYLFAATVADNIRLGRPDASHGDVVRAATLAGADGFAAALRDGYDTPIGERGLTLSAGQRQRIALARAFLRDAPLLLLDEPTAHLDPESALVVQDAVERLMAGRTVILVAHSHGWARGADRVVTLADGRVSEGLVSAP